MEPDHMTAWEDLPLTEEHASLLKGAAVLPEWADRAGCFSSESLDDLPEGYPTWWQRLLPGLVFPWVCGDVEEYQLATDDRSGHPEHKYVFRNNPDVVLNQLVDTGSGPVLIVEGS